MHQGAPGKLTPFKWLFTLLHDIFASICWMRKPAWGKCSRERKMGAETGLEWTSTVPAVEDLRKFQLSDTSLGSVYSSGDLLKFYVLAFILALASVHKQNQYPAASWGHADSSLIAKVPVGNPGDLQGFTFVLGHVALSDLDTCLDVNFPDFPFTLFSLSCVCWYLPVNYIIVP